MYLNFVAIDGVIKNQLITFHWFAFYTVGGANRNNTHSPLHFVGYRHNAKWFHVIRWFVFTRTWQGLYRVGSSYAYCVDRRNKEQSLPGKSAI
jgi:hypothetical protein